MTQLLLDAALPDKLARVAHPVDVIDNTGRVIGRFIPTFDPAKWEEDGEPVSNEELDRLLATDTGRHTPEEVMEYLRKLK